MTDSAAKPSFALREYLKLLIEFDELQSSGHDDSPRINEVSEAMDAPWDAMTEVERDFARKALAALNEAWVEVNPMLGRVAAAPRNGHGLTANMMERLAVACWKGGGGDACARWSRAVAGSASARGTDLSERMSDARAAALFERLRLMARGDSLLESSSEAIVSDWRRARAAEARLRDEILELRKEGESAVNAFVTAQGQRDAERALVRQLREESARRLRGLKDAEATLRPWELPAGHRDLWSAAEYRMRELDAERARADLAEQAQQAHAAKNAKLREELERVAENRAELVEDVASAVAERDAKHAEVIRLRQDAGRLADEVQVLIQRRVLDARSPAGDALLDFREPPRSERGDRLVELEDAFSAERVEAIRLRLDVEAERARTEMAEQTRDGLLEENARLRAALKGLSVEKWWPDRQSHGPCWCAYNSADWADHAPRCKRAAEALGHGGGDETAPPIYEGVEQ